MAAIAMAPTMPRTASRAGSRGRHGDDGRLEQRRNSLVRLRVPPHGFTPRPSHVATFHGTSLLPRS